MKKSLVKVKEMPAHSALGSNARQNFLHSSTAFNSLSHTQFSDMPTEMGNEIVEICTTALDKFLLNRDYEGASTAIKNTLDKKFGPSWQCAIGEGFGFDISCQQKFLLHMYYGKVGILCYKS